MAVGLCWNIFKPRLRQKRKRHCSLRQLLAYGGTLRYSVAFYASDGIGTSNLEPQVLIRGGRTRKQVIYVDAPAPENGVRQEQEVGMKEVTECSFHIHLSWELCSACNETMKFL